jgi:hypothetical protein
VNVENDMFIDIVDDELYVYNSKGINVEAMILYMIRELIEKKLSPHLPLIIDHGKCNMMERQPVDKLVVERHGLPHGISVPLTGHYETPLWKQLNNYDPNNPVYRTNMTTFDDLCVFIQLTKDDNYNITLPNGIKCNAVDLIDSLSISYITLYDTLFKNNIYLVDMHPQNLLIHWLNDTSYVSDEFIGNADYIYYKHPEKADVYLKIKTFGLVLKVGDVGACIAKPREDVHLVGQAFDLLKTSHIVKEIESTTSGFDFMSTFMFCMSFDLFKRTKAFEIFNNYPYSERFWMSVSFKNRKDSLTPSQLLEHYSSYFTTSVDKKEKYVVF